MPGKIVFTLKISIKYILTKEHLFCKIDVEGVELQIKKIFYNAIIYNNDPTEKARDDSFDPETMLSKKYKSWHTLLDLKTCLD